MTDSILKTSRDKLDALLSTKTAGVYSKAIADTANKALKKKMLKDVFTYSLKPGAIGAGVGGLSGLGLTYLNSDENTSFGDYVKNGLIGAGIGGLGGATGAGIIKGQEEFSQLPAKSDQLLSEIDEWLQAEKQMLRDNSIRNGLGSAYADFNNKLKNRLAQAQRTVDPKDVDAVNAIRAQFSNGFDSGLNSFSVKDNNMKASVMDAINKQQKLFAPEAGTLLKDIYNTDIGDRLRSLGFLDDLEMNRLPGILSDRVKNTQLSRYADPNMMSSKDHYNIYTLITNAFEDKAKRDYGQEFSNILNGRFTI